MGLRKILDDKDPALHKVCRPVEKFDGKLHKLLDDMAETLEEANGVGLAAPQIGILRRVVIVDTGEEILELVNPELLAWAARRLRPRTAAPAYRPGAGYLNPVRLTRCLIPGRSRHLRWSRRW